MKTTILGLMIVIEDDEAEPDVTLVPVPKFTPDDLLARLIKEAAKRCNPEQRRDAHGPIFQI
ncbi:MAG TPA: hypothetical protein DEB39_01885 [Planctomycetaceae bacterium]|nr:hypothetical protein [Planctomycetaceae bacterium]